MGWEQRLEVKMGAAPSRVQLVETVALVRTVQIKAEGRLEALEATVHRLKVAAKEQNQILVEAWDKVTETKQGLHKVEGRVDRFEDLRFVGRLWWLLTGRLPGDVRL